MRGTLLTKGTVYEWVQPAEITIILYESIGLTVNCQQTADGHVIELYDLSEGDIMKCSEFLDVEADNISHYRLRAEEITHSSITHERMSR